MEEIVTQYTVEEVKQILFENKATPEQAATLLAIGYLESKFTHGIDGATDSNDKGLWQINPPQYFTGETPDNMTKEFFEQQGEELSLDDFTKKVKYDINYATKFAIHIVNYRDRNPKSYGPDPYDAWKPYTKYIKPNMKRLAPTDELILLDGLDAEITQAINYYKTYNEIPFGKQEEDDPIKEEAVEKVSDDLPSEEAVEKVLDDFNMGEQEKKQFEKALKTPRMNPSQMMDYTSQVPLAAQNKSYGRVKQMLEAQVNKQKKIAGHAPVVPGVGPQVSISFNKALEIAFKLLGR